MANSEQQLHITTTGQLRVGFNLCKMRPFFSLFFNLHRISLHFSFSFPPLLLTLLVGLEGTKS